MPHFGAPVHGQFGLDRFRVRPPGRLRSPCSELWWRLLARGEGAPRKPSPPARIELDPGHRVLLDTICTSDTTWADPSGSPP